MRENKTVSIIVKILVILIVLWNICGTSYSTNTELSGEITKEKIKDWYFKEDTKYGDTATYKETETTKTGSGTKTYTYDRTIYTTFNQVINEGKRGDRLMYIVDIMRRNPVFCIQLGVHDPDSKEYLYRLSWKTKLTGLHAKRIECDDSEKKESESVYNARLAYILCNRLSNWYNWSEDKTNTSRWNFSGEAEHSHSVDCMDKLEEESKSAFEYFKTNKKIEMSAIPHDGIYKKASLFVKNSQYALWDFWNIWLNSEANELKLYSKELDTFKGSNTVEEYLNSSSKYYGNKAGYLTANYKNVISGLKIMNISKMLTDSMKERINKYTYGASVAYNVEDTLKMEDYTPEYQNMLSETEKYANYLSKLKNFEVNKQENDKLEDDSKKIFYKESSNTISEGLEKTLELEEKEKIVLRNTDKINFVENGDDYIVGPIDIDFAKVGDFGAIHSIGLYDGNELLANSKNITKITEGSNEKNLEINNIKILAAVTDEETQSNKCVEKKVQSLNIEPGDKIYITISKTRSDGVNIESYIKNVIETGKIKIKIKQIRQLRNSIMLPLFSAKADIYYNAVSETDDTADDMQTLIFVDPQPNDSIIETIFENVPVQTEKGKIKVIKIDSEGNKWAIQGIKFDVLSSEGEVVTNITTDSNGEATTGDLEEGTYTIKETSVPDGYVLRTDTETVTVVKNTTTELKFVNPAVPKTKVAGIVWLDQPGEMGKTTALDYTYNTNVDKLVDGVTVKLQGSSNGTQETVTSNGGKYEFDNIDTADIENLYIEFEYNGQKYQSVPKLKKGTVSNGSITYTSTNKYDTTVSKAEEGSNRTAYTEKYKTIDNNSGLTYTEKTNGNQKVSKVNYNSFSNITASTKLAGINFEQSDTDQDGFRLNVNLGLMERPETDFALYKDIYKASVTKMNDSGAEEVRAEQVYNKRSQNGYEGDWAKIVVDESLIYDTGNLISREYKNSSGTFAGVQLYVDYIIELENQSGVIGMPKDIVDYYDSSIFTVDSVKYASRSGTDYTEAEDVQYSVTDSELKITNTKSLRTGEKVYILVRQKLKDPEGTLGSLPNYNPDDETTRKTSINYAEIKSYYTDDGLIDSDSAPGNFKIGQSSMEDDEAKSPKFIIRLPDVKEVTPSITGTVWNDARTVIATGTGGEKASVGNGYYNLGEDDTARKDVEVKLERKDDETWNQVGECKKTDGNGNYKFETPGEGTYRISYKIDDGQNEEATIFNAENISIDNEYWYKSSNATFSMARENNEERTTLNELTKDQNKDTNNSNTEIWAITPEFKLDKESIENTSAPDEIEYNINFGIVERPKSKLTLSTYIDSIKVIASDGVTIISDTKNMIDDTNVIIGKGLQYNQGNMNGYKSRQSVTDKDTLYKLEINDSTISNSNIVITYKAIVKNTGDIDFTGEEGKYSERYVKKSDGTYVAKGEVVKTKIKELLVYIPSSLTYESKESGKWQLTDKETIKSSVGDDTINGIGNSSIIITKADSGLVKELKPGDEENDYFQVSRTVDPVTINNGDINVITSTEITKTENEAGKILTNIELGNLNPEIKEDGKVELNDTAEDFVKLTITPETGDTKIPYIILFTGLTMLAVGISIIKKKV